MGFFRGKFAAVVLTLQVVFVVLFALFVEYDEFVDARNPLHSRDPGKGGADPDVNQLSNNYPMFQDVHVMVFAGIGFIMTFLSKYGFSSVGLNMLIGSITIQWSVLMGGFLRLKNWKILINVRNLITADFGAAVALISFGAVLGRTSPLQMVIIGVIELVFFHVNEWIGMDIFQAIDIGGSVYINMFAAYFGLALTRVLYTDDIKEQNYKKTSNYHSDLFSMIGTLFLWMYWPSLNSVMGPGDGRHRAVINTYLALAASAVVTFAVSSLVDKHGRFTIAHVQSSTLAGGVAIGTAADMMVKPWVAVLVGSVAGLISVLGNMYLTPFMARVMKIHDTCGVHNLHGMPGILSGVIAAIFAAFATEKDYGKSLYKIFPARAPVENSTELADLNTMLTVKAGSARTSTEQALYQLAAVGLTLAIAIIGGVFTGFIMRIPIWDKPRDEDLFDDRRFWNVPQEGFDTDANTVSKNGKCDAKLGEIKNGTTSL